MRRTALLLVALTLASAACSQPHRAPLERVTGTIGASPGGAAGAASAEGVGEAPGAGIGSSPSSPAGPGESTGVPATTTKTPVATDGPARLAAADVAMTAYFDALKAEDFVAAQNVSAGGARLMTGIRDVVARYNAERDGVSKLTYAVRSFHVASNEPTRVSYAGSARLNSTVSGPAGDPHDESTLFENPTVSLVDGTWRVADYTYDARPLGYYPATSRQDVGGVRISLRGGLSFGTSTGLIVDLSSDADHTIKVEKAQLTYANGTTAAPSLRALITGPPAALYLLFDRIDAKPTAWSATITIDGGTSRQASANVVLKL
jgi:hypothetical protein